MRTRDRWLAVLLALVGCSQQKRHQSAPTSASTAMPPQPAPLPSARLALAAGSGAVVLGVVPDPGGTRPALVVWTDDRGLWASRGDGSTVRLADGDSDGRFAVDGDDVQVVTGKARLTLSARGEVRARAAGLPSVIRLLASHHRVVALTSRCDRNGCTTSADVSIDGGQHWLPSQVLGRTVFRVHRVAAFAMGDRMGWVEVATGAPLVRELDDAGEVHLVGALPSPVAGQKWEPLEHPEVTVCAGPEALVAWSDFAGLHVAPLRSALAGQRGTLVAEHVAALSMELACNGAEVVLAIVDVSRMPIDNILERLLVWSSHDGGRSLSDQPALDLGGPRMALIGAPPNARIYFSQYTDEDRQPGDGEEFPDGGGGWPRRLGVLRVLDQRAGVFAAPRRTGIRDVSEEPGDPSPSPGDWWALPGRDGDLVIGSELGEPRRPWFDAVRPKLIGMVWSVVPRR